MLSSKRKHLRSLCSILRLQPQVTGIYGDEVTPVPIPNTEVKLISVENTWLATAWEDRAMPVQMKNSLSGLQMGSFLLCRNLYIFRQSFYQSNVYVAIFAHKCLTKAFFSFIVDMCHFMSNNGWRLTNECPEKRRLGKDFSLDYADRGSMFLFAGAYGVCSGCKIQLQRDKRTQFSG